MTIGPMIKDFLETPVSYASEEDQKIDVKKWKENFEKANRLINSLTPEEKEKAQKLANEYLFGKS